MNRFAPLACLALMLISCTVHGQAEDIKSDLLALGFREVIVSPPTEPDPYTITFRDVIVSPMTWKYLTDPPLVPLDIDDRTIPFSGFNNIRIEAMEHLTGEVTTSDGQKLSLSYCGRAKIGLRVMNAEDLKLPDRLPSRRVYLLREGAPGQPIYLSSCEVSFVYQSEEWPYGSWARTKTDSEVIELDREHLAKSRVYNLTFELPNAWAEYRLVLEDVALGKLGIVSQSTPVGHDCLSHTRFTMMFSSDDPC